MHLLHVMNYSDEEEGLALDLEQPWSVLRRTISHTGQFIYDDVKGISLKNIKNVCKCFLKCKIPKKIL